MFNPLTRTLKLGLTAITILTSGGFAGTAFAQASAEYCGNGTNYDRGECSSIIDKPNAANWARNNRGTTNRIELDARGFPLHSHIVRGLRTSLDTNGGSVNTAGAATNHTTLNLRDARFNGERLGGDATDGVGYFYRIIRGHGGQHAGIFAGTDLGGPVTGPAGTARWVGRASVGGLWGNTDFVLEVTFGNAGPGKVGSVAAFIPYSHSYWGRGHIYLGAKFDATGYIWGTATAGQYVNNRVFSRDRRFGGAGRLHGLIGEKGAVGAFVSGGGWFAGGFVARPAQDVEGAAVYLKELCESNRAHEFCFVSDIDADTIVRNCINNPFGTTTTEYGSGGCARTLGASRHRTEKANHIAFCNRTANVRNDRCTSTRVVTAICDDNLFGAGCLSHTNYESQRISRAKVCAANLRDSRCTGGQYVSISNICSRVPFGTYCTSSSYESHRITRAKICAANLYDSRCTTGQNVTRSKICSRVPFGAYCTSSTYQSYRVTRAKICAANLYDSRCTTGQNVTRSKICSLVPFGAYCTSSAYESYRVTRAKICAANLRDSRCTTGQNITTSNICTRVPFGTACTSSSYESHRVARAKICAANLYDSRCTTGQNITTSKICTRAAFVGVCVDDGNFDDERTSRLEFCDIASNSNHPNCTDTNLSNICSYAPFSPVCLKHSGSITKRTDIAFNACRPSDSNDPKCYGVRKMPSGGLKPNAATWVDGFVTISNPNGLSSVVDPNRGSQFVEASKTNVNQTNIHLVHRSAKLLRELDTTDGVGFLWGETRTGSQIFVAGILADTDLGAPLREEAKTSVVWRGEFQSLRYDTKTDFDLKINFGPNGAGSIEAFIERKIGEYDFANTPHYYLDGRFDANGLITGRVIAGRFVEETPTTGTDYAYQGVLRGIIGEDGAVGAFVGGKSRDNGITFHTAGHFAGGFVAAPAEVVEYADWEDIFNPDSTRTSPLTNQFLAGSDGTVASGSPVTITFANASYGGDSFNGDGKDGVQLFTNPTNGAVTNVYAGILTTTNLGAPLDATTAAAVWEGRLFSSLVTGAPAYEVADFRPYIDFNESSMDATITGVTQSDGTALARSVVYSFYAEFDTRGVIDGTITRSSRGRASTGELTGLIGAEGAVGAFISDPNARVSYAGGFVARPTQ